MNRNEDNKELRAVAEKIRAAYLETALTSYEDASANGLCAEGAWECAVDSMRHLEITDLLQLLPQPAASSDRRPNF
ncbi:MAG: acetyltransferase [Caldilineaceae bacterium]|nr:acetyltransferase [Caldilineaceae bacterium]